MRGPLDGITVLELGEGICAPYAAMQLADTGCTVVKVEPIAGDYARTIGPPFVDGESALFLTLNRNKRGICLDLDAPAGQEIIRRLANASDVVLDALGPGEAERRGLGYADLAATNPRLVYAAVTAFGESGPFRDRPATELILQALSDYTSALGTLTGPPIRIGSDIAQINTAQVTVQAIVAALLQRTRTGKGQRVSTSMLGTLFHLRGIMWTALHNPDEWIGINLNSYVRPPDYGYQTKDRPIMFSLGRGNSEEWYELLVRLDMLDVIGDPRFDDFGREAVSVGKYAPEVKHIWERAFRNMTAEEVASIIREFHGNAVPVTDYKMLSTDPQIAELGMIVDIPTAGETGGIKGIGLPWTMSGTPISKDHTAPPSLGQHTADILAELGYSGAEIERLRGDGVIRP